VIHYGVIRRVVFANKWDGMGETTGNNVTSCTTM
jgi:hypothetical protein